MALSWLDLGTATPVQAVLGMLVLCILLAAAISLMARFRDYTADDRLGPDALRSNFQEMLRRGDITEAEYRKIQSKSYGDSIAAGSASVASAGDSVRAHDTASRADP